MIIDRKDWQICKICGKHVKNMDRNKKSEYFQIILENHVLNEHSMIFKEYIETYFDIPKCPCGICDKKMKIGNKRKKEMTLIYGCGRYPGTLEWSENAKENRKGKNNPMYKKIPWNKGKKMPDHMKEMLREISIKRCLEGKFNFSNTKPHLKTCSILDKIGIEYIKEFILDNFFYDIKIKNKKILIEVDGDYYHCNPEKYINGPINDIQKRTIKRDLLKNEIAKRNGYLLIRVWEHDLNKREEEVECKLKKLLM